MFLLPQRVLNATATIFGNKTDQHTSDRHIVLKRMQNGGLEFEMHPRTTGLIGDQC